MLGANSVKLFVDARKLGDGGIGVYIENLLSGFIELIERADLPLEITALLMTGASPASQLTNFSKLRWIEDSAKKYSLNELVSMPLRLRRTIAAHDLYHVPHYTLPYNIPVKRIVTIHDIIHVTNPDTALHRPIAKGLISSALRRAHQVITVSQASRQAILANFRTTAPISVVPNALRSGIAPVASPRLVADLFSRFGLSPGFLLFVGDDRPHKNFSELYQAWLRSQTQATSPSLVAVGRGFSDLRQARFFAFEELSSAELSILYSGARAVVMPSKIEGFGLVALEALACGVPLIARGLPSVREICGELASYYYSTDELFELISRLTDSNDLVRELDYFAKAQSRANCFSQRDKAQSTLEVYARALAQKGQLLLTFIDQDAARASTSELAANSSSSGALRSGH